MQTAIIFGGTSCNTVHEDDTRHRVCKPDEVPVAYVNFDKVRDVNEWYGWLNLTLLPNVRVQPWYNGRQVRGRCITRECPVFTCGDSRQVKEYSELLLLLGDIFCLLPRQPCSSKS